MEEKRKKALFRYIVIMFTVAFVLVTISLVGQTRSVGQLSESSVSAIQRAASLQDENRLLSQELEDLELENQELVRQVEELEQQLQQAQQSDTSEQVQNAYEGLLSEEEQIDTQYLGPKGLEMYENLTKEVENND